MMEFSIIVVVVVVVGFDVLFFVVVMVSDVVNIYGLLFWLGMFIKVFIWVL